MAVTNTVDEGISAARVALQELRPDPCALHFFFCGHINITQSKYGKTFTIVGRFFANNGPYG
jgi:hypothetical protein